MQMLGMLEKLVLKDKFVLIVISHFTFPMVQSFFRLILFYLISLLLPSSSISLMNLVEIFVVLTLMSLSILGISLIIASFVLVEKRATFLSSLIILSVVLFSGVLYPIEVMPELIQKISYIMPTRLGVDLIRAWSLNDMILEIMPQIMFMVAIGAALILLGIYLLNIALEKAKTMEQSHTIRSMSTAYKVNENVLIELVDDCFVILDIEKNIFFKQEILQKKFLK